MSSDGNIDTKLSGKNDGKKFDVTDLAAIDKSSMTKSSDVPTAISFGGSTSSAGSTADETRSFTSRSEDNSSQRGLLDITKNFTDPRQWLAMCAKQTGTSANEMLQKQINATHHEAQGARKAAEKSVELGQQNLDINQQNLELNREVKQLVEISSKDKIELHKEAVRSEQKAKREHRENRQLKVKVRSLEAQLSAARDDQKENKVNGPKAAPKDGKKANEVVKGYAKHTKNLAPGAGEEKAQAKAKEEGRFLH